MAVRYPLVLNGTSIEELQSTDTLAGTSAFDAGTKMLFIQTAAPTGWTKSTTHDNKALRIVSGTAGSGGSVAFTTAFANVDAGATTLSTAQMPSHQHPGMPEYKTFTGGAGYTSVPAFSLSQASSSATGWAPWSATVTWGAIRVAAEGGGGSHTHSLSLAVQYVDAIIATKD